MSITSMTGFGRGSATDAKWGAVVEISAVNRKQFDCSVTMPRAFAAALEARALDVVRAAVARGAVRVGVTLRPAAGAGASAPLDLELARRRVEELRGAAAVLGLPDDLAASALMRMDELFAPADAGDDGDAAWPVLEAALKQALGGLLEMRRREGAAIAADIRGRLVQLAELARDIRGRAPEVPKRYAEALRKRLAELGAGTGVADPDALAREVALFADRCDISEEMTRLASHFEQAETLLASEAPCGRALDFLCQEFFREINTTGSKANDLDITRAVIAFKTLLEAVREQVQNIE
ncbi:MAG: YicC family protein [Kiritimatiellaeota bacterium]|nr:YicC family protein [Kiritimatiellota bacterium]